MQILLTGGTGFIGSALVPALLAKGHELVILSRGNHPDTERCRFVSTLDAIDSSEVFDALINLAGASLAARRWTDTYKQEIVASRIDTTRDLLALVERLEHRPAVLLSASAIGYYGHSLDQAFTEDSVPCEEGFAQALCRDWKRWHQRPVPWACASARCALASYWMQAVAR